MNIKDLMKEKKTFSFEVFPPKIDKPLEPLLRTLEELYKYNPDFISCTYGAGGSNAGRNEEICQVIKKADKAIPVTHLTCIGNTKEEIKEILQKYNDMGVESVLALRGDIPEGWESTRGDFKYASELIAYIRSIFPKFCIGMAATPEKHIESLTFEEDIKHLKIKQDAGADYIMTQLCHDTIQFEKWLTDIREAGIYLPISVGIMPVLAKDPTLRMAVMNGCAIPRDLAQIIAKYGDKPEEFKKAGKEYTILQINKYNQMDINGIHIYSMNRYKDVGEIVTASDL